MGSCTTSACDRGLAVKCQVVDHCNLNCAWCDHLAPLKDPWCAGVDQVYTDLRTLTVKWPVREVVVYGGEPLLHPRLSAVVTAARLACPQAELCVETNGLLVPTALADPGFTAVLRRTGAQLRITEYPCTQGLVDRVNVAHPGLAHHAPRLPEESPRVKHMFRIGLHDRPLDDPTAKRMACYCKAREHDALCLRAGVVYPCPLAMCAPPHLPPAPDVGLRVADASPDDLHRLARCATPLCAWCAEPVYGQPWRPSTARVDEWRVRPC